MRSVVVGCCNAASSSNDLTRDQSIRDETKPFTSRLIRTFATKERRMSELSIGQVVSGRPYSVVLANGRRPSCLGDFGSDAVMVVSVRSDGGVFPLCGSCRVDGDAVILYEKRDEGTGMDVRTWQITGGNGQFEAVARSLH